MKEMEEAVILPLNVDIQMSVSIEMRSVTKVSVNVSLATKETIQICKL